MKDIHLVCLDIDGTISDRFRAPTTPGTARALGTLRQSVPVRLVTNATSLSHARIAKMLLDQGLPIEPDELITPATAARQVLTARGHMAGALLVEEAAREDFDWFTEDPEGPAVLLGTEAHRWTIGDLQPAFRMLLGGATLYTLQQNRYFRKREGLVTDLGPLAAFFSYASGQEILNLGKPSALLFDRLAQDVGCRLDQIVMVGDDAEFDASGSVKLGMHGILVRTGKYRTGDELRVDPPPTAVIDSVDSLLDWLS